MTHTKTDAVTDPLAPPLTQAEIEETMTYVDDVHGDAGHHLTDPILRELLRLRVSGEIDRAEYKRRGTEYLMRLHGHSGVTSCMRS